MSYGIQRWVCGCGANNMPEQASCFRCGAPPGTKRRAPMLQALWLTLAVFLFGGATALAVRRATPPPAAVSVPTPEEEKPPFPDAVRTPGGWKIPGGGTMLYQSDVRRNEEPFRRPSDAFLAGLPKTLPCGHALGAYTAAPGRPPSFTCVVGHRFRYSEGVYVPAP